MEKKESMKAITFALAGTMLQMFNGISGGWAAGLTAIFGLVLLFIGITRLKEGLDDKGKSAVKLLIVAAIICLLGFIFDIIPLMGLIAAIILIVGFIIEMIAFIMLRGSASIGSSGQGGAMLLMIAMILAVLENIFSFIPALGGIIGSIFSIAAIILVFFGWLKIQEGIIMEDSL